MMWRDIPGFEGKYQVSDEGQVRSFHKRQPKILAGSKAGDGYRKVILCAGPVRVHRYVHRLVLEVYTGPCPAGMEACHANAVRDDNRLRNLRWDTPSENNFDTVRAGSHAGALKTHCPQGHALVTPNLVLSELRRGRRKCRACNQARSWLQRHAGTISSASNRFYAQIKEETR